MMQALLAHSRLGVESDVQRLSVVCQSSTFWVVGPF